MKIEEPEYSSEYQIRQTERNKYAAFIVDKCRYRNGEIEEKVRSISDWGSQRLAFKAIQNHKLQIQRLRQQIEAKIIYSEPCI